MLLGLNALVSEQYRFMPLIMVKLLVYSRFLISLSAGLQGR